MTIPRSVDLVNSQTTTDAPSSLQIRNEYNPDQTTLYMGFAQRGTLTSENTWTIFKYTYTAQQMTLKQTAFDSWDNRAIATYA